jgi:hypothetical protein
MYILKFKMVAYIMKKEICGTFHAKCGTRDLTYVFGTVRRKAGRVVTLVMRHTISQNNVLVYQPVHLLTCFHVHSGKLLRRNTTAAGNRVKNCAHDVVFRFRWVLIL